LRTRVSDESCRKPHWFAGCGTTRRAGRSLVATAFSPSTTYGSAFPRRSKNPNAPRASADPGYPHDYFAGCELQHQQTAFAKKKSHDAMFFVNTAPQHLERFGGEVANLIGLWIS
jgi:hypothetical protein